MHSELLNQGESDHPVYDGRERAGNGREKTDQQCRANNTFEQSRCARDRRQIIQPGEAVYSIDDHTHRYGKPQNDQAMYRKLLASRFKLAFHRESRELPAYAIVLAKGGPKLAKTERRPEDGTNFSSTKQIVLTVRNASMGDFAHGMQEEFMDKPVVDQTGLKDRFDFDLKWTPDEAQSSGEPPVSSGDKRRHNPDFTPRFKSNSG